MGNRAIITSTRKELGIFLHWNGGRDSVEAFLRYCELRGFRPLPDDYGLSRLAQVIGNYFGGGLSLGILPYTTDDQMADVADDNGVYVVDGWEIVDRVYPAYFAGEQQSYDMQAMLLDIDEGQPSRQQLGREFIIAEEVESSFLKVGDFVFVRGWEGEPQEAYEVVGFGEGTVNGRDVTGVPFVAHYGSSLDEQRANPNNYIDSAIVRLAPRPAARANIRL